MPLDSDVTLRFEDFDFNINSDFKLDSKGYLDPIVYEVDLAFGDSSFTHDNWFLEFIGH